MDRVHTFKAVENSWGVLGGLLVFLVLTLALTACVPRLGTSGRNIVNSSGQTVMLRGANVMRSEWDGNMNSERQGLPLLASDWKGNIVVRGFASAPVNARSASYLALLDEYVSLGRDKGFYVVFSYRSAAINGSQPTRPDAAATSALTYLAQRYRAESHVLFGLQVEPHDVTWASLRPQFEAMISQIRGPSGSNDSNYPLIFVPGARWSHDLSGAITDPVNRPNVVYNTHPYGSQTYWQHDFKDAWNAGRPVFVGEFSLAPDLGSTMTEVNALISWTRDHGVGWSAWIFDTCACGAGQEGLITSWSTTAPTNPYGVAVRNEMRTTPPVPNGN